MKKLISLLLVFSLVFALSGTCFATSNKGNDLETKNNHFKQKVSRLDIKKKYNPLRKQANNANKINGSNDFSKMVDENFNDENVHFVRVTYYDKNKNKVKEYKGESALEHLYKIENQQAEEISLLSNYEYAYKTTESYVDSNSKTTIIREKPLGVEDFHAGKFVFDAGFAFANPVISILSSAISQFLDGSLSYKARDVEQTEIFRFYQNLVEMRQTEPHKGDWFPVITAQKRVVNLKGDFYIIDDENGDLTTFDVNFGKVEETYHKDYDDDDKLIEDAKMKWNKWPYQHIYSWEDDNAETDTFDVNPIIIVIEE